MNIKACKILFILSFCFVTSGCWDYTDIEELAIPQIVAYDTQHLVKDKNIRNAKIDITLLFPDTNLSGNRGLIERIAASTIGEGRNKRSLNSSKNTNVREVQAILLGEQLARRGTELDILLRQPSIKDFMVVAVVKGRGDNLIEQGVKKDQKLGYSILGLLNVTQKEAFIVKTTLHNMAVMVATPGKNMVIPLIELNENQKVRIIGTAIFKKNRLKETIDQNETRALVLLSGIKSAGNIKFEIYEKGKLIDQGTVFMSNTRKVTVTRKDGKYHFKISIKLNGNLIEHYNTQNFTAMIDYNKKIEKAVEKQMKKECQDFLAQMQKEFKIDCIDISKYALAKWRKELEKKVDDEEFITKAVISVEVKAKIDDIGERT